MVSGLTTSAAAMDAQTERLAVLANNLANITAAGFKADHPSFFQLLSSPRAVGLVSPTDPTAPLLTRAAMRASTDFSAGTLRDTGNTLDVALEGSGFFVVGSEEAPRLTRAGAFTRTREGFLAAADGTPVLDARRQPIRLPEAGQLRIEPDGTISTDGAGLGQMLIVEVPDPSTLTREGGVRFVPPATFAFTPSATARVRQGTLELSNVNPVLTMVEMIDALRVYESAQRAARGADETLGRAINDVGRI
jgi:flagellar basal-body rod protein FlgF